MYLDGRLRARAREAYRATSHLEGDKNWSDFVERAILAEVLRRETVHNDGQTYAGDTTPLSPGRPLG
ncbi:ParB family protein [Frondihabitans sp. Leaf304]|uniref:ParB family protein n=1 Tax=Frondihabitans sp. Leaf304 TaxID=1736329 RepID=UPI003FA40E58